MHGSKRNGARSLAMMVALTVVATITAGGIGPGVAVAAPGGTATISTVTGTAVSTYSNGTSFNNGTIGVANTASFNVPMGAATDAAGNVYVADMWNCRVRRIDVAGLISDFAGNGTCGYSTEGTNPTTRQLNTLRDVVVDNAGALYLTDGPSCRILKVVNNTMTTIVNVNGTCNSTGVNLGDGGLATSASLSTSVSSLAIDGSGNLIIADTGNAIVRRVTADGMINRIAGNGSTAASGDNGSALLAGMRPEGVAVSLFGNIVIADTINQRVRMFLPGGTIQTVAGTGVAGWDGDGSSTAKKLNNPGDVAVDGAGTIFVADTNNCRIRKVTPTFQMTTVVGSPTGPATCGESGENGAATSALVGYTTAVSVDRSGSVLLSSLWNGGSRLKRVIGLAQPSYPSVDQSLTSRFRAYGDTNNATHTNWSGGDGPFSIKLSDGRIAWFFADSYTGHVNPDHSRGVPSGALINNQVVIEDTLGNLANVYSGTPGTAFFAPAANGDVYWPQASNLKDANTLQVLLRKVNAFGFPNGVALATITLPAFTLQGIADITPKAFRTTTHACTGQPSGYSPIVYGNAVTFDGTNTYIHGVESCASALTGYAYVAMVAGSDLTTTWKYFNGTNTPSAWPTAATAATRVKLTTGAPDDLWQAGDESSIVKTSTGYRMITSPGSLNGSIYRATASTPWGPWSTPTAVYAAPEFQKPDWGPNATCVHFTYNAKEQAAYATASRIVVTYNLMPDFLCAGVATDMVANVDNYRPRFVGLAP
jgi:sugar lactone lactonase YvrE